MKTKPEFKHINSSYELVKLNPGDKTKVTIDTDKDPEHMVYKGREKYFKESTSENTPYNYYFIEIPKKIEEDTEFRVWYSEETYLHFSGNEGFTEPTSSSILFNHLYSNIKIITHGTDEYEEIKSLVEFWMQD